MKNLFVSLLLFVATFVAFGQCTEIEKNVDKFDNSWFYFSPMVPIITDCETNIINIGACKTSDKKVFISFVPEFNTCFDINTRIIILCHSGKKYDLNCYNKFNCTDGVPLVFSADIGESYYILNKLRYESFDAIRLYYYTSYYDMTFSYTQSYKFKRFLNCIIDK